jgi:DNA polymerase-3 subunit epsilon
VSYNSKVSRAISYITENNHNFIIREAGRNTREDALVVIQEGRYCGYGFIPKAIDVRSMEDIMAFVIPQKETIETKRLVSSYILKNQDKIIPISN